MGQGSEGLLVAMLNIDAEIRARVDRLAEMERGSEDYLVPWLNEARVVLRTDLAMLRARRDEQFLGLNGLVPVDKICATGA